MFRALRNSWRLLALAFRFARHDALFPLETLGIAPTSADLAKSLRARRVVRGDTAGQPANDVDRPLIPRAHSSQDKTRLIVRFAFL